MTKSFMKRRSLLAILTSISVFFSFANAGAKTYNPTNKAALDSITLKSGDVLDLSGLSISEDMPESVISIIETVENLTITTKGLLKPKLSIVLSGNINLTIDDFAIESKENSTPSALHFRGAENTLILSGDNIVKRSTSDSDNNSGAAIGVFSGSSLKIKALDENASLEAVAGNEGAGIGSGNNILPGKISIESGKITATGGIGGAGIGVGGGSDYEQGGEINISGGEIIAKAISHGAGIGGGSGSSVNSINITGGVIEAEGAGSDLGSGVWSPHASDILIDGGIIKANRIGGINNYELGNVTIKNGSVFASSINGLTEEVHRIDVNVLKDGIPQNGRTLTFGSSYTAESSGISGEDGYVYAWLPAGEHSVSVSDAEFIRPKSINVNSDGGKETIEILGTEVPENILINSITVKGLNDVVSIEGIGNTLQMIADVSPENATDKSVTWSIRYGSSFASIDPVSGLLTALEEGSVNVRAKANDGSNIIGEKLILIKAAPSPTLVSSINVRTESGKDEISLINGELQMIADVLPENATDKSVTWSAYSGDALVQIDEETGLLQSTDAEITVRATANDSSKVYGEKQLSLSAEAENETENPDKPIHEKPDFDTSSRPGAEELFPTENGIMYPVSIG